ncbi:MULTISPECIES: amino acid adenylation domain-containing protein, partial [unclassified Pseudomonas]|uniref:amino acid adenylation domain-containing protein n=1 Tax=unclassified Pseudomonas TaxID=196821 RepID=UPI0024488C1F
NYPLTIDISSGESLCLRYSYNLARFTAQTISEIAESFRYLLEQLVAAETQYIGGIPLLTGLKRQFLTHDCNASARDYPLESSYVRLFEMQVTAHPQRMAASCLDEQWSYVELNQRANRLGHALQACGVGIDQPVALLAERSLSLLGMIVGTFKAGAGYLPLDPDLPEQRLTRIIELSRSPVLVCSRACHELAQTLLGSSTVEPRPHVLIWEDVQATTQTQGDPGIYSGPRNLAYVIYTSGSTGLPKGVMVEQAGMLNNQLSKIPYLGLSATDVVAQTASQSFDISVWQFLTPLLFGGRVEIVPNNIAHVPARLAAHIDERRVSVLESVPALIQEMLTDRHTPLASLRWLLPTGEAMPPDLARQWLARYPDIGLVNAYGPAECSDDVAFFRVDRLSTSGSYLPIGSPTDNNRLYVLDGALQLVPTNTIGELYVAGTGVGRGYIGDSPRTAQAFIPDPFGSPGERLYRTGDLARRRSDGALEYIGRIDQQVKIRGLRIELGEIEAALRQLEAIREVAVSIQEGTHGPFLVGHLVPMDTQRFIKSSPATAPLEQGELFESVKAQLRLVLPQYMVPLHWMLLEHLPRNANGKIDRKALPAVATSPLLNPSYQAPSSEQEQALAEIWTEILGVGPVSVHDNFFELGGHSLLAMRVASRIQLLLGIECSPQVIFEYPVLADLASQMEKIGPAVSDAKLGTLEALLDEMEEL